MPQRQEHWMAWSNVLRMEATNIKSSMEMARSIKTTCNLTLPMNRQLISPQRHSLCLPGEWRAGNQGLRSLAADCIFLPSELQGGICSLAVNTSSEPAIQRRPLPVYFRQ